MPEMLDRESEEVVYLLFVKAATLPVWLWKFRPDLESAGTIILSAFNNGILEGEDLYQEAMTFENWPTGTIKPRYWEFTSKKFSHEFSTLYKSRGCYPMDCEFVSLFIQLDIYCSNEESIALDEAEYIKFRVLDIYQENPVIAERYHVFLIDYSESRNVSGVYKMAPQGFERVVVDFRLIVSRDRI